MQVEQNTMVVGPFFSPSNPFGPAELNSRHALCDSDPRIGQLIERPGIAELPHAWITVPILSTRLSPLLGKQYEIGRSSHVAPLTVSRPVSGWRPRTPKPGKFSTPVVAECIGDLSLFEINGCVEVGLARSERVGSQG